jgi:hypothetical protein
MLVEKAASFTPKKGHSKDCHCADCVADFFHRFHNLGVIHRPDKSVPDCIPIKIHKTWWEEEGMHNKSVSDPFGHDFHLARMLDRKFPVEIGGKIDPTFRQRHSR